MDVQSKERLRRKNWEGIEGLRKPCLCEAALKAGRSPRGQNGPIFVCYVGFRSDESFAYLRNFPVDAEWFEDGGRLFEPDL